MQLANKRIGMPFSQRKLLFLLNVVDAVFMRFVFDKCKT
jgi:hypothetical protein